MNRLVRLYASNLLSSETILAAGNNLRNLKLEVDNQLTNDQLGIGDETWISVAALEEIEDTAPFFEAASTSVP